MKTKALVIGAFFLLASAAAHAMANPTKYVITILSFQLKNNTGGWITVVEPDRQVDLKVVDAEISFFNNGRVPPGNYSNFKIRLSPMIKVSGHDHGSKTTAGGRAAVGGTAKTPEELPGDITVFKEESPTWNEEKEGPMHVELRFGDDPGRPIEIFKKTDFAEPMRVKKNSFIHAVFILSLEGTLFHAERGTLGHGLPPHDAMIALPPKKLEELRLAVDGDSRLLEGKDLVFQF